MEACGAITDLLHKTQRGDRAALERLSGLVLVDHARRRGRNRRGSGAVHVSAGEIAAPLDGDLVAIDDALKDLAKFDQGKHDMVELHYFGGLSLDETAHAIGVSAKTVQRELRLAESWLHRVITEINLES